MKAIIIDDERLAREELKSLLDTHQEITLIGEAKNGEEAIETIKNLQPDVIFLDIEMPGLNGFEVLKKLDITPHVIFVTAHDNHALDAFNVNAVDYLLKPIDPVRLKESIKKLKIIEEEENDFQSALNFNRKNKVLKAQDRVLIKEDDKLHFPKISEIKYIESEGNYASIYFGNKCVSVLRSLNYLETRLDPNLFFRANRKIIVNMEEIESIANWFNGGIYIKTKDGLEIQGSRRQGIKFRDEMMF